MKKIILTLLIVFSLFSANKTFGLEPNSALADSLYKNANYELALEEYLKLNREFESASLYYNIGNTYFQLNNLPYAILYFEKAKKFDPNDSDILFNLKIANQKIVDKVTRNKSKLSESIHRFFFGRSVNFWPKLSVIFSALGFLLLAIYLFAPSRMLKLASFYLGIFFMIGTITAIFLSSTHLSIFKGENEAIIVAPKVDVKNAPIETGKDLFILHEGTKVSIKKSDQSRNWYEIAISSSNVGWIKKEDLEVI